METLQRLPFKARKAVFERLEQIGSLASLTLEERMKYDASINTYRTLLAVEEYEIEQRKKEREEGRKEEKAEMVKNLKQLGVSTDIIAKATGLPPEEIEKA
ncbi:hypothetical protein [Phocaeicola salanitronis]|uniref:hypothetical protein n=1 Tax=Phocaeicola salanitronis TaxID=376805 RepID=UPI0023F92E84|nr:hypothetical protein [Phocaeicola salanitronis]